MGKKKGGGGDGGQAVQALAQQRATDALIEGRNQGYSFLDKAKKESLQNINPLIPTARNLTQNSLDYLNNFDANTSGLVDKAQQAYLQPAQRQVSEQLNNLFGSLGTGGRNNSRGQLVAARMADELAFNQAQRQYQLTNDVRNQALNERTNLFNIGMNPIQQHSGIVQNIGTAKANTATGTGSQLASTFMQGGQNQAAAQQQNQQNKQQAKGQTGQLIGTGLGAVTSLAGAFSDANLKENIKPVGKLDNGLTVYSYNFKGVPYTEIGLIAQEVQKVKPEAVYQDKHTGYLKVVYSEATK